MQKMSPLQMPLAEDTLTPPANQKPLKTNKTQLAPTALMVSLLLIGHQSVHSQTLTESAARAIEAQRRSAEREEQLRKQLERTPHIHLQEPTEESKGLLNLSETPCFVIKTLEIKGLEALDGLNMHSRLSQALDKPDTPIGQCLGVQGIQTLLGRLQNALVAHGYITSRVDVGPQNIQSGHLQLVIVPGRLGQKRLQPDNAKVSLRNVLPLHPGDTVNLRNIEQALENLKRPPTAEADIQIEPGQEPGLSDLVIDWKQSSPYRWGLTLDDSGTRSTGKIQGSATLHIDNPLGLSDLLYLTLNQSLAAADPGPRGTKGYTAHYSLPWNWWTFSATLSDNRYHQSIAGAFQNYIYSGTTQNIELKANRIVQRDSLGKTSIGIKAFQRASRNFIEDTEVQVQRRTVGGFEATVGHQRKWGQGNILAQLNYKRGTGAFGSLNPPEEAFGEGTSRMQILSADASVEAPFQLGSQKFTYNGSWRAQNNRTILSTQDQFSIGGRHTVRGFDGLNVLSAERGWTWRNELVAPLGQSGQKIYLAIDHGRVSGPSAARVQKQHLTGGAIGLRGQIGPLQFDVFAGRPLQKPDNLQTSRQDACFAISANF